MEYNFREIEEKWQKYWAKNKTFAVEVDNSMPKYYVLDMFPYPSGAGLHVGHPLGYIASDIYSRFKRLQGFNVLHPMGYDAFGLPAEQYAIQTGQHPANTTENNIKRYREQLDKIGFSYDWNREVRTCNPKYYKWTQWAFLQMFKHWYNNKSGKAEPVTTLIAEFEKNGNSALDAACNEAAPTFDARQWQAFTETQQQEILLNYRLAYLADTMVNWCPALGTVLANDEVKEGFSVRGGHPVTQKKMKQWLLRITAYAERLLEGLNHVDWSDSLKEIQKNWIGKSMGAMIKFHLTPALSKGEGERPRFYSTDSITWSTSKVNVKENRKNPTEAEAIIWDLLKNKQTGFKFRRQHAIDKFIADFVCIEKKTVIEIDGKIHEQQEKEDLERTAILNKCGFTVLRFKNEEVIANTDEVIEKITDYLQKKVLPFGEDLGGVIEVFTTRPDTIFGVTYMVIAPEHDYVNIITTPEQRPAVEKYIDEVKKRTERERMADVKRISGVFTGAYAINPFTNEEIPIWIGDYVLAGYGTGAVMAVPAHDSRDWAFANHFGLPKKEVITGGDIEKEAFDSHDAKVINSGFITGMTVDDAILAVIKKAEETGIGYGKVNYRLRDAIFSRQRYWGEPFPIYYKDGLPYPLDENSLPLELPEVDKFLPTEDGQPPLGRAKDWKTNEGYPIELSTMPGFAGSSAYYLRYMDPHNPAALVSKEANNYWQDVDLYIGGTEHATGHLVYSRFWNKFLFDLGLVCKDEPFRKLINQGMIQGLSMVASVIFVSNESSEEILEGLKNRPDSNELIEVDDQPVQSNTKRALIFPPQFLANMPNILPINIPVKYVDFVDGSYRLSKSNLEKLKILDTRFVHYEFGTYLDILKIYEEYKHQAEPDIESYFSDDYVLLRPLVEKMSKSKDNVVNPDDIIEKYGADTLRMYEMFLGPLEQAKPWDTNGIEGVHRFFKKLWRLFHDESGNFFLSDEEPANAELKVLHKLIKKVKDDIEHFSFNTSVSAFMICVNELSDLKCNKRKILLDFTIVLSSFAPHIAEELWELSGNNGSLSKARYPQFNEKYLVESVFEYPVSFNGKMRFKMELPLNLTPEEIEKAIMHNPATQKYTEGKAPKKVVVVQNKIVNVVV